MFFQQFDETRVVSQRIPFPPQTKISERDVIRKIRTLDRTGSGKQTLDQCELEPGDIGRALDEMKRAGAILLKSSDL